MTHLPSVRLMGSYDHPRLYIVGAVCDPDLFDYAERFTPTPKLVTCVRCRDMLDDMDVDWLNEGGKG